MPGRRLWLLAAALVLPGAGKAEPARTVMPSAPALEGESFGSEDEGKVIVARKARFATKDAQLSADEIRMNTADGSIEARGNVIYTSDNLRIFGERALIDSRSGRIVAEKVRFGRAPTYFAADRFTMEKGDQRMEGVTVWHREPAGSGMGMKANEATYSKSIDRLVLTHIHPTLGGLPFFYIPRYAQRGYRSIPADVYFRLRTSSRQGAFVRTTTTIRQSPTTWTGLLLDVYAKAGVLIGPSVRYDNWNLPDAGSRWKASVQGGWIRDQGDLGLYPDIYGRTIDSERFFVNGSANGRSADGWETAASVQVMSDPEVARDFRPQFSRPMQQPQTFVELSAPVAGGHLSALASAKTDDFQDVVQRLPEVRLDLADQPLWGSQWQGRLSLAAARLSERPSEQLNGLEFLDVTGQADRLELTRLDAYAGASRPTSIGDWLVIKPVAGVRTTWWSEANNGTGALARTIGQFGFDAEMLAVGTWDTRSTAWGIDGVRHTVRPFVQWRATPASGDDLGLVPRVDRLSLATVNVPTVDLADRADVDTLAERQVGQIGIRNTFETRDAEMGTREFLRADLFVDWREDTHANAVGDSGVYGHLAWNPKTWMSVESLLKFDGSLGNHLGSATWMRIRSGDLWTGTLGLSDLSEGEPARQVFGSYAIRLNSAYRFKIGGTYDLRTGTFIERTMLLSQKVGNSWDLEYGLTERASTRGDGSLGFSIRARLFKF
ncbi:MAG: LPS assembly protein LptD [Opitutales bacterium]